MSVADTVAEMALWASAGLLVYVYWGYAWALRGLLALRGEARPASVGATDGAWPMVTVLLTVFNEERHIANRLRNLQDQDYPAERLEILVASDGSTDATDDIVRGLAASDERIRLFRPADKLGKSGTQNEAIRIARGEVVVLTDAEARFDLGFVRAMAQPFADPTIGCTTANLRFDGQDGTIGASQSRYWSYELTVRDLESRLGILAVASGQAMAFRRSLFRDLPLHVGDDCKIPLDVVAQGARVIHCPAAHAFDVMESSESGELRARTRMTMRNWTGTWMHADLLNPLRHPGYAFALWSHKLLRWLSGAWLAGMTLALAWLLPHPFYGVMAAGMALVYTAALVGWWGAKRECRLPLTGTIYSFVLANVGFTLGVLKALRGHRIAAYRGGSPAAG